MLKKSSWARSIQGKSRYFRRDDQGLLYFPGPKNWYQVTRSEAQYILVWLFIFQLPRIACFALLFILILFNKFAWLIPPLIFIVIWDLFIHWHLLRRLSRDLTPVENLPSSAWKQYWANEVLLIDSLWLICCLVPLCICIALSFYALVHGDFLAGILFLIFFVVVSSLIVYRLIKAIHFKISQSARGI